MSYHLLSLEHYQPSLRRLLYRLMELLMLGAIVTGYWMYDCYESGQAALKQALIDLAHANFTGSNLKSGQPY